MDKRPERILVFEDNDISEPEFEHVEKAVKVFVGKEYCKNTFKVEVSGESLVDQLNGSSPPEWLGHAFLAKGIQLSQAAGISVLFKGAEWEVTDNGETYLLSYSPPNLESVVPGSATSTTTATKVCVLTAYHGAWVGAFGWHDQWRAKGTGRIRTTKKPAVTEQQRFQAAFDFCSKESFCGICFFDFKLDGVSVEQLDDWNAIASELDNYDLTLSRFVVDYPGLLLAIATARNPNATADLYLATSSGATIEALERPLKSVAKDRFYACSNGSLTKQSEDQLVELLKLKVQRYVETHSPDEIENLLWPHHAADWFSARASEVPENEHSVPHNRPPNAEQSAFKRLTEYANGIATYGKMIGGVDQGELSTEEIETVISWVHSDGVYEVLKSFVGSCSPFYAGTYPFKLSVFTFSLLAAVGPGTWLSDVPWKDLASFECPVLGNRQADCRQAVVAAYRFFRTLQVNKDTGKRNTVIVRFSKGEITKNRMSLTYLDFSFSFSCIEKDGKFLRRLCGGSAEPERISEDSDSPLAFKDLKMSLRNPKLAPQTHVWVFPETVDGIQRTVIRFGVYDSERFRNV